MLCHLRRWLSDRVLGGDRGPNLRDPATAGRQPRHDPAPHLPVPACMIRPLPRRPGQTGRPRLVGARQPSLQAVPADPTTVWTALRQHWPDGTRRHLQAATGTTLRYHPDEPTVPLRWLLLRDPNGRRESQALLCTDPDWTPAAILTAYQQRWWVEVTFQEVRTHLDVETQRQGSEADIARTTPALLGLSAGTHPGRPPPAPGAFPASPPSRLACQDRPHLLRCPGLRPPHPLDPASAFSLSPAPRRPKLPQRPPAPLLAALYYSA